MTEVGYLFSIAILSSISPSFVLTVCLFYCVLVDSASSWHCGSYLTFFLMASPSRPAEDSAYPLISSLMASVERLPDSLEIGTPDPVLAKNRTPVLTNFVVPAVRFRVGTRTVAAFPLHREAIGDLWDTEALLSEWDFDSLSRGWAQAVATFKTYVDYPIEFLQLFLTTLRAGHFLDNTPITSKTWRDACQVTI